MYKSCVVVGLFFFNFLLFSNFYVSPLHAGHTNLLCPVPVSVCALPKRALFSVTVTVRRAVCSAM